MSKVKVISNQNLLDIALQEYGSVEGVINLVVANNRSITDDLFAGDELIIDADPVDQLMLDFYRKNQIKPATGVPLLNMACRFTDRAYTNGFNCGFGSGS